MLKYCNLCSLNKKTLSTEEFDIWIKTHECNSNNTKSSRSLEAAGAIEIFNRCITKHNLICHEYDISSYKEVVDSKPYVDYSIISAKLECVEHVQKRLGTKLRTKVKEYKGTATSLSGADKPTEKTINLKQNYYGKAIRSNSNEPNAMKKAVGAILWQIRRQ